MVTYNEMYSLIVDCIIEQFDKPIELLTPETTFKEDLNLDSLDKVDLLCAIEDKYGKDILEVEEDNSETTKKKELDFYMTKTLNEMTFYLLKIINNQ